MGHYYKKDGTPCYVQPDGKDTNIRHAREQKLVPSVTEVLNVAASPGLEIYKQNQLLDACIEYPPNLDVSRIDEWRKEIVYMSKQHAKKAAERGAEVHDQLEEYFKHGTHENPELVDSVSKFFSENFNGVDDWVAEASFASPLGYGGKVDLHSPNHQIILDFKTKNKDNFHKARAYDSHHMQTAAYAVGLFGKLCIEDIQAGYMEPWLAMQNLPKVRCYNLFINVDNYQELKLTESTRLDKAFRMFYNLLEYWKLSKNYDSGE